MTQFGFVVATVLVNTLFVFDLYCTRWQQRHSVWGATMRTLVDMNSIHRLIPLYTLIISWVMGLVMGNDSNIFQVYIAALFWVHHLIMYAFSTKLYYNLDLHKQ